MKIAAFFERGLENATFFNNWNMDYGDTCDRV